jgi:Tol biopolymer transport system component
MKQKKRRVQMKKHSILIAILVFVAFSFGGFAVQSGYDFFQKALAKERAEGNIEEAIALYQKVIEESKDKALAAKAQLRIGYCYEKLGLSEAQKAFQKVIDNYPAQTEAVKTAKEKLAVLIKAKSVVEKEDMNFEIRPVWQKPKWDIIGAPSPDGKYLSYVDWDTGDLAYREISTEKTHRLTDKAREEESQECAYDSKWSPDSKQIAYCWENDQEEYVDLRVIGTDSKEPRILHRVDYNNSWVEPGDWTPDGKHILIRLSEDKFKFGFLSVADGSLCIIREIASLEQYSQPGLSLVSPDGEYIAYDFQQNADTPNHDIFLLSVDGTSNVPLAPHPSHDFLLGWAPDGRRVVFASDRAGTVDLWHILIEAGKQKGDPVLLRRNIGSINPLGLTQDGSFYFNTGKSNVPFDIYTAAIDSGTGEVLSSPKKLPLTYEGNNTFPAWSPDGKHLAYISRFDSLSRGTLCIYSVETGKIHVIPYKHPVGRPRWFPGGQNIIVRVSRKGIYKVNVRTEDFSALIERKEELPVGSPSISPDNRSIFYVRFDREKKVTHVMARDLQTGEERELYSIPLYEHSMVLSPDGKQLALMCSENPYENKEKKHMLKIIPVDGGAVKEVHSFIQIGSWGLVDVAWSSDGQYVFFSKLSSIQSEERQLDWDLWKVAVEGGQAEKMELMMHRFRSLSVHPDGQQIAFASHSLGVKPAPEVWIMENFLPEIDKKK